MSKNNGLFDVQLPAFCLVGNTNELDYSLTKYQYNCTVHVSYMHICTVDV